MPWIEATLRGQQKVLARAKDDGSFDAQGGLVEIRYKAKDTRAYRAGVTNLAKAPGAAVLPDDTCPAGEFVARDSAKSASPGGGEATSSGKASGKATAAPIALTNDDWVAYTDGACSGNPGPAGAGVIVIVPGGVTHEGFDWLGTATNNIAELTAILRAVEAIPAHAKSIVVHTDSQYAIGVLTKGWKPKVNQELIRGIKETIAKRAKIRFVYVPGHAGVPLNERADELAREAIRVRKSQTIAID